MDEISVEVPELEVTNKTVTIQPRIVESSELLAPERNEEIISTQSTSSEGCFESQSNCQRTMESEAQLMDSEVLSQLRDKEKHQSELIKQLESKLLTRQERLQALSEQLEDSQRRQAELEIQLEQANCHAEESCRERDEVVGKLALLEEVRWKLINDLTTAEHSLKEATKENEKLSSAAKSHKSQMSKITNSLDKSEKSCSELNREANRLREESSSLSIKLKWAQNKLKTEADTHKDTKAQLTLSTKKLKEAREEGEQIRADLKRMIQQYQESEEMRSNSLGLKLEKTEQELKAHEQEIADQQELHELTVKELELTKTSLAIAQQEVAGLKAKLSEASGRGSTQGEEIEQLKRDLEKVQSEQKQLSSEKTELEKLTQTMETERSKFTTLREAFTTLQKSHGHLERELVRQKDRQTELLTFSEKLSSANAELTAQRNEFDAKMSSLTAERDLLTQQLLEVQDKGMGLKEELRISQEEKLELTGKLNNKTRAVEELTLALEDEREMVKANRKKNTSNIRDLQRQLQHSKRRIDYLEASLQAERESPATLPITDGSRASSHNSLNEIITHNDNTAVAALTPHPHTGEPQPSHHHSGQSLSHTGLLSDDEHGGASPSPELLFTNMDQEKLLLVERLCRHKKDIARLEEKIEFFEEHTSQLTEDIQRKSKIIQSFILREQSGALAPALYDEHKARHSKKPGVMATIFTAGGKNHRDTEMSYELSLEMNQKMQSILEDTLLKNITLKENIDTLGTEIQRLSAQLHTFETNSHRR